MDVDANERQWWWWLGEIFCYCRGPPHCIVSYRIHMHTPPITGVCWGASNTRPQVHLLGWMRECWDGDTVLFLFLFSLWVKQLCCAVRYPLDTFHRNDYYGNGASYPIIWASNYESRIDLRRSIGFFVRLTSRNRTLILPRLTDMLIA